MPGIIASLLTGCHAVGSAGIVPVAARAPRLARPVPDCDPADPKAAPLIGGRLRTCAVTTLNTAGPGKSRAPGIEARTFALLRRVFGQC